jgi:hypothetical protein
LKHSPQQHEREREDGLAEGEEGVVNLKWQPVNSTGCRDDECDLIVFNQIAGEPFATDN